mmetsp:Transcript_14295/g.30535  ORF Transcript_14295/g.30535 Transcript_14295/m.30535 type:complete len:416 (-) Transcript_14295:416-1663(-)
MIAPPSAISISEDEAGNYPTRKKFCGEMTRVVSMQLNSISSSSLAKLDPVTSQSAHMSSDDLSSKKTVCGIAMHQNVIPPIVESRSPLLVVGTEIVHPTKDDTNPITLDHSHSRGNAKNEASSLAFQRSQDQGETATSTCKKYKKRPANTISGRWTPSEHEAFLRGLKMYGREWKKVATCIPTRTSAQIRSHAQKYFVKVTREQQQLLAMAEQQRRSSSPDGMTSKSDAVFLKSDQPRSKYFIETVNSIINDPSVLESRVCQTLASLRERYKQLEVRLQQSQVPPPVAPPVISEEAALGPATAALELEQNYLWKAAVARHERKTREDQLQNKHTPVATETNAKPCARVSLASIPSHGGFDSSDVIALSRLGGSLGRDKVENKTISTINDDSSPKLVRDPLQLKGRPTKLRKMDEH